MKHVAGLIFICYSTIVLSSDITIDNWRNHTDILKIRNIYNDIEQGIKTGAYKNEYRKLDLRSQICGANLISQSIYFDESGVIRKYTFLQQSFDNQILEVSRYYDNNKQLRFVFNKLHDVRIYLDERGAVIWSVKKTNSGFQEGDWNNDDWEVYPANSTEVMARFTSDVSCPKF